MYLCIIILTYIIIITVFFSPDGKRQAISAQASWHRFVNTLLLALRSGSYMMHVLVYIQTTTTTMMASVVRAFLFLMLPAGTAETRSNDRVTTNSLPLNHSLSLSLSLSVIHFMYTILHILFHYPITNRGGRANRDSIRTLFYTVCPKSRVSPLVSPWKINIFKCIFFFYSNKYGNYNWIA